MTKFKGADTLNYLSLLPELNWASFNTSSMDGKGGPDPLEPKDQGSRSLKVMEENLSNLKKANLEPLKAMNMYQNRMEGSHISRAETRTQATQRL